MFQDALRRATKAAYESTPTLNMLISYIENGNLARVRSSTLAEELGVSTSTIDRHLAKLRKLGLIEPDAIERDKKYGVTNWRVCPFLGWSGGTKQLKAYLGTLPSTHQWQEYNNVDWEEP